MTETTKTGAADRLHAMVMISTCLQRELDQMIPGLGAFLESPKSNPISGELATLYRAASFCGLWGVGNYLGALRELAQGIENVAPELVERNEFIDRVRTLGGGIKVLGVYLRDLSNGNAVSYAELNEQFGRIIRKARPQLLEVPPAELIPLLYMAAPPSLEVDSHWTAAEGASKEMLIAALEALIGGDTSESKVRAIARANPYRSLSGLFESAACLHRLVLRPDFISDHLSEMQRLLTLLSKETPVTPPIPDAFLFSRLMYSLAQWQNGDTETRELRRRYSLTKPGSNLASMHDVARKFADGIKKLQDAYVQATLAKTPSAVAKLAAAILAESHRLESASFTTVASSFARLTASWATQEPSSDDWTYGAALVLLLRESAETWGYAEAQEALASLSDMMAATGTIFPCSTIQTATTVTAIQKTCAELLRDLLKLNKSLEQSLVSVGADEITGPRLSHVADVLGGNVYRQLQTVAGVMACLKLPEAARYSHDVSMALSLPTAWATTQARNETFTMLTRVQLFVARLRPGSMLDMEPDEQGEINVGALPQKAESSLTLLEPTLTTAGPPQAENSADAGIGDAVDALPSSAESTAVDSSESMINRDFSTSEELPLASRLESGFDTCEGLGVVVPGGDSTQEPMDDLDEQYGFFSGDVSDDIGDEIDAMPLVLSACADTCVVEDIEAHTDALPVPVSPSPSAEVQVPVHVVDESITEVAKASEEPSFDGLDSMFAGLHSPSLDNMEPSELEKVFIGAQEGRISSLNTSDSELLTLMFEESWECMDAVDGALARVSADGSAVDGAVAEARRHIHTLKGVCRTVGLEGPGATLHAMEDSLEVMPDDGVLLCRLLKPFEVAIAMVRSQLEGYRASFHGSNAHLQTTPLQADAIQPNALVDVESPAVLEIRARNEVKTVFTDLTTDELEPIHAAAPMQRSSAHAGGGTVRIPLQLAGAVSQRSGEVLMASRRALEEQVRSTRSMRELDENLRRMAPAIRELEMMAATSIASSMAQGQTAGFDPLELDRYTQMQEVVRRLSEAFEDTMTSAGTLSDGLRLSGLAESNRADLSDDLQRGASELLMVPVSSQVSRLERVVNKACADTGRQASLVIEPGCRVPAAALDKLMPVFEHILRNAVAHGVESVEDRVAAGKSTGGRIVIGAPIQSMEEGGVVRVCVRDDGAGIDLHRVKAVAVRRCLVPPQADISDDATRELLFKPGFSTASAVSELAGRGVGLDVVRSALSSLGGAVSVNSAVSGGTEFTLTLPTDATSMAVVPVTSSGFKCLIPLTLVRRIVPVSAGVDVVVDLEKCKATIAGVELELIDMSRRVKASGGKARAGRGHLVLMRESNVVKAVLVDSVGQQTRVVVMPLGPYVRDIPGMVAGTTMSSGGATLVVNPLQLPELTNAKSHGELVVDTTPRALIVDDSPTVRLVTSRTLQKCGFAVDLARDGLEAMQILNKGTTPEIFIFDLEMPGMGGFELIAEVRRRPEFKMTPIVIISSRTAEKHRERAMQLGANDYLAKPYEDAELQEVVTRFQRAAA